MMSFSPTISIGISLSEKIAKIVKRIVSALIIAYYPVFSKYKYF
tara:strand:- start:320 stop:451 length:132 start_codon:yes stop_codon:yes gene_type:complete